MPAHFQIQSIQFHVLPMHTRFPFRYGMASLTSLPHLWLTLKLDFQGKEFTGWSSEGLPPKWFTKNPETTFERDLADMIAVIQNAARLATSAAASPTSFMNWWSRIKEEQVLWARTLQHPPLLASLGLSLMERALLDALSRACGLPLHHLLQSPELSLDLLAIRPELPHSALKAWFTSPPLSQIHIRHTVGLSDALYPDEAPPLYDGLPVCLADVLRTYDCRFLKIKLSGQADHDIARLGQIAGLLDMMEPRDWGITLDGNEQFSSADAWIDFWHRLSSNPALKQLWRSLLFVEQPIHRDQALSPDVSAIFEVMGDLPCIIDESEGDLSDLPTALALGYRGTSYKSCKGLLKGLANAALLRVNEQQTGREKILSGEDLANVGPVSQIQDLTMMSLLQISHVERNGHHYFRGLSMYPETLQRELVASHPDLYHWRNEGYAALHIHSGSVNLGSLHAGAFSGGLDWPSTSFFPIKNWILDGGLAAFDSPSTPPSHA